jgi:trk system potassium uptake protein TrkH
MSPSDQKGGHDPRFSRPRLARQRAALRHLAFANPARFLAFGYLSYMLAGWAALMLPFAQATPVRAIDALFIAVSAVSTTGLVTVDPGGSFTAFGEAVILLLILAGGLGYMTLGSFAVLALRHRMSPSRERGAKVTFGLPDGVRAAGFVRAVILFSFTTMTLGALALWPLFQAAGLPAPLWQAVFHAVSAFCTAGFSLLATGMEPFRDDLAVNIVISTLSILGALGFLVVVDLWQRVRGEARPLMFSSAVILRITLVLILGGALFLGLFDPGISAIEGPGRWYAAFFQAMTASTTVGFNTVPIAGIGAATVMVLALLMLVGASPAGTGGGLKTTTFAVILAQMLSVLRRKPETRLFGYAIPPARQSLALASLGFYLALLLVSATLLLLTEAGARFEIVLFEAISALSTVGLSMGITGSLTDPGKLIVTLLMFAGRVGILSFALAVALRPDQDDRPAPRADIVL